MILNYYLIAKLSNYAVDEYQYFDNVTRWLNHEGYTHTKVKQDDTVFRINIENLHGVHIFEPKEQKGVLVIGIKIKIPQKIHILYKKSYNNNDKINFRSSIDNYAKSIEAIHHFYDELDGIKSGVYIVLDSKEKLNLKFFMESLNKIVEMGDLMNKFLIETKGSAFAGNGRPSQSNHYTRWGSKFQDLGSI